MKCLMNGLEVNHPCSPVCALFGDCVTAFESQKKANVRTNADRIRAMTDEELASHLHMFVGLEERIKFCRNLPECDKLLNTEGGIPEEKCVLCLLAWLKQPAEEDA